MDAFIASILAVALAEVGDKTQLLALFLTAVFARKSAIVLGIFVATILNHAVSAWFGVWISEHLSQSTLTWIVAISFIAVGLWLLIPDKDDEVDEKYMKWGAFVATTVLFFFAEIGDKTQIATVLLAANYNDFVMVLMGSTAGMMLANVPVVYMGAWLMKVLPFKLVRIGACILFLILGVATLLRHYYF
ncbi:Putative manganese exporter [Oligella sp. MSHR50489EDL]|uniref:TMEM165/GDT1 family protein n=1 Tax=Oligella sp. MSHR50489EDL TaxID=3139409 RepID=UPI003D81365B